MLLLFIDPLDNPPLYLDFFGFEQKLPGKRVIYSTKSYKLRYIVGGHGWFNGTPISRGACCLSAPEQQYVVESSLDMPLTYYWLEIAGKQAPVLIGQFLKTNSPTVLDTPDIDSAEALLRDFMFSSNAARDISLYAHSVFYHLLAIQAHNDGHNALSSPMMLYRDAVNYIEEHYNEHIKIANLCDRLHIVPDYLYKIFRRYSGMSTQEYILRTKMRVAESMLCDSQVPIAEIAETVGYHDYGLFSKVFRKICGCSPMECRRDQRHILGRESVKIKKESVEYQPEDAPPEAAEPSLPR